MYQNDRHRYRLKRANVDAATDKREAAFSSPLEVAKKIQKDHS